MNAAKEIGVKPILSADEMIHPQEGHLAVMAYAANFVHFTPVHHSGSHLLEVLFNTVDISAGTRVSDGSSNGIIIIISLWFAVLRCVCLSVHLSVSVSLTACQYLTAYHFVCLYVHLCLSDRLSGSLSACISLPICLSVCLYVRLCLSDRLSGRLSVSLSV